MIHSEEYLSDTRFCWHNEDYLDLLAKRFKLANYSSLADIGCGLGHWNKLLLPYLKKPAKIYAVDFEQAWLDKCKEDKSFYLRRKCDVEFICSKAEELTLPDNFVDIVSCQTLLIHVKDIKSVLKEFYRIVKPGGIIICSEPNNLISPLMFDLVSQTESAESILNKVRFELSYAKGKEKLGQGKSYAVEIIPELMRETGFKNIRVYLSDKAEVFSDKENEETFNELFKNEYEKSRQYYSQVNNNLNDFEEYWKNLKQYYKTKNESAEKMPYLSCKGALMYIMYGEKSKEPC